MLCVVRLCISHFLNAENTKMRFQMFASAFLILLFSYSDVGINLTFVSGQSDRELLLELRNNLAYNSSLSTKLVNWDESTDFCHWPGVKCHDDKGRVSSLDLSGESISGGTNDAASTLFRLVNLRSLNLAENSFGYIELPSGFGKLTELRYLNLSYSGFSGQVPLDFSNLTRLVVLDLTYMMGTSLENPDLRRLIHNFTRLRELYLDGVNISANGNEWGSAISSSLPNLKVLSLSNCHLTGPFDSSLQKLRSLTVINLDDNAFSSPFPQFFADFPNLRELSVRSSILSGVAPRKLFQIKSLAKIDLRYNLDLEGSLPEFPVNGSLLQYLLLSSTKFSGNLSESIGNLRMLSSLYLANCSFSGPIPSSIKNLTQLFRLDLSLNRFSGHVPSFALSKKLTAIYLSGNRLTGQIPASLFVLPLLEELDLSNNSFSGTIGVAANTYSPLLTLNLSENKLEGPIPRFLFELQNLWELFLSSNKFYGSLELTDFQKLTNLSKLDLSYNNLSVHVNEEVSISSLFPRLEFLRLASCKLQKVPLLKNFSSLTHLDLSDNQLDGEIPNWIWEVGSGLMIGLNLSHNRFNRIQEPYVPGIILYLDLHSNMLGGQIPDLPTSAWFVDFSSNVFSSYLPPNIGNLLGDAFFFSVADNKIIGNIPPSLCNASSLQVLDLSNNSFHGRIPFCLLENPISVLNLRRNNLDGDIPDTFPVGCRLETLDLGWNVLQGKVPKSLTRCTEIEVLNLGNNVLDHTFPCWLKKLPKLRVLVLRFNKLNGNIDCLGDSSNTWPNLQIIDFASNNIEGVIHANMFRKLQALMVDEDGSHHQPHHLFFYRSENGIYYQNSVTVTLKGHEHELTKILTIFTSIDFSDNHLQGIIPQTIGELKSLHLLNFSHNALSGHIPSSIGNLKKLDSLDLSFNNLDGVIPTQLASLTSFSFLNLSYNHFVGRIPEGNQIRTFPESFIGNGGLCGFPLNKTCNDTGTSPAFEREQGTSPRGIFVSAALGFLVGLGILLGPLMFCKRWRRCYNKYVDRFILFILRRKDRKLRNKKW